MESSSFIRLSEAEKKKKTTTTKEHNGTLTPLIFNDTFRAHSKKVRNQNEPGHVDYN